MAIFIIRVDEEVVCYVKSEDKAKALLKQRSRELGEELEGVVSFRHEEQDTTVKVNLQQPGRLWGVHPPETMFVVSYQRVEAEAEA